MVLWFLSVLSGGSWGGCGGGGAVVQGADFLALGDVQIQTLPAIVINELHIDPDVKTEQVEFVELCHPGTAAVDLSGWRLDGGVFYTFPAGTRLAAGGYLIVAQNPEQVKSKWVTLRLPAYASLVLGPFGGKLDNESDSVILCDAAAEKVDEVDYQLGFPWPKIGRAHV